MTRVFCLVYLFLAFLAETQAQCPTLVLFSTSGNTCGITPITISGNTFGGNASRVTITENGSGTVSPTSSTITPFSFTYTPNTGDIGKKITITITTDNPPGSCSAVKSTYVLSVNTNPSAPVAGTITKPTCTVSTGSVLLTGLPSAGLWTINRKPGDITTTGSGTSVSIAGLTAGTYTFTVTNAIGCISPSTSGILIPDQPAPPASPVQTTDCSQGVGKASVKVSSPVGTGYTYSIDAGAYQSGASFSNIADGNHSISVKNSAGCITAGSAFQVSCGCLALPAVTVGLITQPTCSLSTGSVLLSGLPSGSWTLTRSPGSVTSTGTGASITISDLPPGTYTYTVTNSGNCTSPPSSTIVILANSAPSPPVIGTITQPGPGVPTGSVVLTGLPETGSWTLQRVPDNTTIQGSGKTVTVAGLIPGSYNFSVTNSAQCTSGLSDLVTIGQASDKPVVHITFPTPVCFPATVDISDKKITAGSSPDLVYTYWTDPTATIPFNTPKVAPSGIWYIKGSLPNGIFTIEPVMVTVYHAPVSDAGADQILLSQTTTNLDAELINNYETGLWSVASGSGEFFDPSYPKTTVSGLSAEKNSFVWKVTNGICPASLDTVVITIREDVIPTLITPNMDGKNDYLIIKGLNPSNKIELVIFDRRGVLVFKSENYDNRWNGVDMNGQPLDDDTYFYVLKSGNSISHSGYFLIRK